MSFLDDLESRLNSEPRLTAQCVIEILRREWGGMRVYISSRVPRPDIDACDTPQTIQAEHKVSRSTAHRWVTKWR